MRTEKVTLNGQQFFLRRWGKNDLPVMLCLHGFPEYGGAWEDIAPHLAHQFHIIAPDQRGFGQSWAPSDVGDYATGKLVGDMAALIGDAGPVTVFGHDWGAAVAYGLAMFQPALVERLIIANGVHPVPFQRALASGGRQAEASQYINVLRSDGSEDYFAKEDFAKLQKLFSAKMNQVWLSDDRLAAYKTEWARPGRLRGMINWYRASPLKIADPGDPIEPPPLPLDKLQVSCPHLVIWGMEDTALLPEATEGLEDFCADLTRVELEGFDHWLLHQAPERVAEVVLDWIERKSVATTQGAPAQS